MRRVVRFSSRQPRCCSSALSSADTRGVVRPVVSEARVKLPVSTMRVNTRIESKVSIVGSSPACRHAAPVRAGAVLSHVGYRVSRSGVTDPLGVDALS
ncbi:hypothetical protein BO443_100281 [Burkholderia orbicola]